MASRVCKVLKAHAATLGFSIADVSTKSSFETVDSEEALSAIAIDITDSLRRKGWITYQDNNLLDRDIFAITVEEGIQTCGSMILRQVLFHSTRGVAILMDLSILRFRRPVVDHLMKYPQNTCECSKLLSGSIVRILPTLSYAIVDQIRIATQEEVSSIQANWAAATGIKLHDSMGVRYIVDVRLDDDEDSPLLPIPACMVLSPLGLDSVSVLGDDRETSELHQLLRRLHSDFQDMEFALWTTGELQFSEMRLWNQEVFQTQCRESFWSSSKTILENSATDEAASLTLGKVINVTSSDDNDALQRPQTGSIKRKSHTRAGPALLALFSKIASQNKEEEQSSCCAKAGSSLALSMNKAKCNKPLGKISFRNSKKPPLGGNSKSTVKNISKGDVEKAPRQVAKVADMKRSVSNMKNSSPRHTGEKDSGTGKFHGNLTQLTVPQLRAYCKELGLVLKGKKSDLVERIKSHVDHVKES